MIKGERCLFLNFHVQTPLLFFFCFFSLSYFPVWHRRTIQAYSKRLQSRGRVNWKSVAFISLNHVDSCNIYVVGLYSCVTIFKFRNMQKMEYNRDSVENIYWSHLLKRQLLTKDSNDSNFKKVDMECSTNNGKSNRLPVDSEVSRLLITVKKEGFVPSVKFEKLLLSRFYESVLDFVKYFHEESSLLYEVYLECVIIVSEKDEQFISCIENLNDDVCNHITEIASK